MPRRSVHPIGDISRAFDRAGVGPAGGTSLQTPQDMKEKGVGGWGGGGKRMKNRSKERYGGGDGWMGGGNAEKKADAENERRWAELNAILGPANPEALHGSAERGAGSSASMVTRHVSQLTSWQPQYYYYFF